MKEGGERRRRSGRHGTANLRTRYLAARRLVRGLGLDSQQEWLECVRGGGVRGVPADPQRVFERHWRSWADFLGCHREWA